MKTYLIVYNVHYKEKTTNEEFIEEMKEKLDEIKNTKDRKLLESIYEISQHQFKHIWYKPSSENLILKTDIKWEELFNFIIKNIEKKRPCNEKQYLEINIENIINLDQI